MFQRVSNERELFWIKYFNTLTPFGLNMNLPIEEVQLPELSQATEVKWGSNMRHQHISTLQTEKVRLKNKLMLEDKFNCNTLDKYKVNNLQKLFDHLENINAERLNTQRKPYGH